MAWTPQEETFMCHGGYGLLMVFHRSEPRTKDSLTRQFGTELVQEALNCNLIKEITIPNSSDQCCMITPRGMDVRNH